MTHRRKNLLATLIIVAGCAHLLSPSTAKAGEKSCCFSPMDSCCGDAGCEIEENGACDYCNYWFTCILM